MNNPFPLTPHVTTTYADPQHTVEIQVQPMYVPGDSHNPPLVFGRYIVRMNEARILEGTGHKYTLLALGRAMQKVHATDEGQFLCDQATATAKQQIRLYINALRQSLQ